MKRVHRTGAAALISMLILSALPLSVYAATKSISSVSIKCSSNLEAGDDLSSISLNYGSSDGGDINVYTSSENRYRIVDAELVSTSNRDLQIGDEVKVKVELEAVDGENTEYSFKGTYSSSNISVSGGEYVSSSKKSGNLIVTIRLKPLKGDYNAPEEAEWRDSDTKIGKAYWKEPSHGSGYYEVVLYRGSNQVYKLEDYKGESFDFYPYMTKKGTYKFKVRTVAHTSSEKKYAKSSDWTESDEYYLDEEHVSNGSGQINNNGSSNTSGSVGWIKDGSNWYYRYPNGSYKKNGWEKVNSKWYLFDESGRMLTGWVNRNNVTYYLNPDGDMHTGWKHENGKWYYLSTEAATEGAMARNTWLASSDGKRYYMGSDGSMSEGWISIGGNWYYFYKDSGYMARDTYVDTFYVDGNGVWRQQS